MPRFFTNEIDENNIVITGDNSHHISRALRMKVGEELTICCCGIDYKCSISSFTNESVLLSLISKEKCAAEPSVDVTLYQAVPKLDKLEYIIQKTVELGVSKIVPVLSRRCISRLNEKEFEKKLVRLNKIAEEAAKQSGRGIIPQVMSIIPYKKAIEQMSALDKSIILYEEEGGCSFSKVELDNARTIGLMIGSEGGFDSEEAEFAIKSGIDRVWLGKRILRCETAPITAMSILMFLTNNM